MFWYAARVKERAGSLAYPLCHGWWRHNRYEAFAGGMQQLLLPAAEAHAGVGGRP